MGSSRFICGVAAVLVAATAASGCLAWSRPAVDCSTRRFVLDAENGYRWHQPVVLRAPGEVIVELSWRGTDYLRVALRGNMSVRSLVRQGVSPLEARFVITPTGFERCRYREIVVDAPTGTTNVVEGLMRTRIPLPSVPTTAPSPSRSRRKSGDGSRGRERRGHPLSPDERFDRIEARLAALERRLARLERILSRLPSRAVFVGNGTGAAVTIRPASENTGKQGEEKKR